MHPIQIAFFGLFLLLMEMAVLFFADTVFLVGVGHMIATGELDLGFKLFVWGGISLLFGLVLGIIGKLLCFAIPEEGARKLIVLSLVFEITAGVLRYLWWSDKLDFPGIFYVIGISASLAYIFFLNFLARVGDNVGEASVGRFIQVIYGLFGAGYLILFLIFVSWKWALLVFCLESLVSLGLYTFTIYTLFRAMPLYVEEVKAGITDPTESGEDRRKAERKARISGPAGSGGPAKAKPPEEPKGEPPAGHKLYRIPKNLEPLHLAVKEGDRYKVELRLAQGDDPSKPVKHGLTPLHIAASVGVMDVADALIKAGASVDATCEMGLTPVYFAIQTGNTNIVGFFLNKGANLFHRNENGYTPLHWACSVPHPNYVGPVRSKMVNFLVSQGADVGAKTSDGKSARDLALENQLEETVGALERHMGVGPKSAAPSAAPTVVESAPVSTEPPAFAPFLGTQLSIIPKDLSELHDAVKIGDPDKVQRQIAGGAKVNEPMAGGVTPIHITAITGVMSVSELLIRFGATVNDECDHKITPIFLAVHLNNVNMVGYLVSRGAEINHQDELGRTPLHWAAAVQHEKLAGQNRLKMIDFLIQNGAHPEPVDHAGLTPLELARAAGEEEAVKHFEERHGASDAAEEPVGGDDDDDYYV